jgi:hypothetical protein
MSTPLPTKSKRDYFPRVREAREALRERAMELFELQVQIIRQALLKGDFESAYKANEWLLEHMPAEDDGTRMIDSSAAEPKQIAGPTGPQIQIGIKFGGNPKELPPAEVIDISPIKPSKDE